MYLLYASKEVLILRINFVIVIVIVTQCRESNYDYPNNKSKLHNSELLLPKQCEPKYTKYKCEE